MKKQAVSKLLNGMVLTVLFLALAVPSDSVPALAREPDSVALLSDDLLAASSPLFPDDLDPPETCGVPGKAPFGEDVEILMGPYYGRDTYRLTPSPRWESRVEIPPMTGLLSSKSSSSVALASLSADRLVAVWRESALGDMPVYSMWRAGMGWDAYKILYTGSSGNYQPQARGNPAIVSRHPKNWVTFVRDKDDYIQYREWNDGSLGSWQTVPGNYRAKSDPVVVSTGPGHMALFFKAAGGAVHFSEWVAGVGWRDQPISLGKPGGNAVSSPLSVASRNENHLAVFAMTGNNQLWYREWTSLNASDWSDTEWIYLMPGYGQFKPAVVSRHANHMGVAVLAFIDGGVSARYKEWTHQAGWKASVDLPLSGAQFWSPLAFAATSTDKMWLFGVSTDGHLRRAQWTEPSGMARGGWTTWDEISGAWDPGSASDAPLAAAVRRLDDIALAGRMNDDRVVSLSYTSDGTRLQSAYQENGRYGAPRAQTVAMVDGKPVWVTLLRSKRGNWFVRACQTSLNWSVCSGSHILGHADSGSGGQAAGFRHLVSADLDGDGSDEVIATTMGANRTRVDLSVVRLTVGSSSIGITSDKTTRTGQPVGTDVNVAVGDLDGDGARNEVVVGYRRLSTNIARTFLYQYDVDGSNLQFKEAKEWTFDVPFGNSIWLTDLEVAIGKTRRVPGEQLILAGQYYIASLNVYDTALVLYGWEVDARGDRHLQHIETGPSYLYFGGPVGEYSTALAVGDVDGDGLQEIVYTASDWIAAIDGDEQLSPVLHPMYTLPGANGSRSLAVGDLTRSGKAEIVYAERDITMVLQKTDDERLIFVGYDLSGGVPLVADLDDDSHEANLAGCKTFREVSVIAVVHGAPVWYRGGQPAHTSSGGVANSTSATESAEDGWHVNLGESVSVGVEVEQSIPIIGTKIAEVRSSVTAELMGSRMGATATSSSVTESSGFTFGIGESGYSRGMVVYDETTYKCDYYDVYKPGEPENAARAMACTPTSDPIQTHTLLEDWHSQAFKASAVGSWADVGRDSNDVTGYPTSNPVDGYLVEWEGDELLVHGSSYGGLYTTWSLEESTGEEQITGATWDLNTTVSAGATIGVVKVDASVTAGYGEQWSRSIGWEEGLCIQGAVEHYETLSCTGCQPYRVVPYVYQATAVSEAGATYPYLIADYYVPQIGADATEVEADAQDVVGLAPQAPIITSTTHPDPATWYPTSTVTFEWSQPAGDPAVVTGYRWGLDHTATVTPTALHHVLTDTHTYEGVADGVYYLHLQALGDGGDHGPVAHRAVRVDANPPQVAFAFDPPAPTGLSGWYNTSVSVTLVATDTVGSGVASVEYSDDGTAWQPYAAPLVFASDTPSTTLWARATDQMGHVCDPVSVTVQVDLTPPSLLDGDGYRLSYASVVTDAVGNAQLVLGGALTDTLSGRLMTEIKFGDEGLWRPVDAVGAFAMLPGNELTSTMVSLNWIYTPTFEARGAWTIWGRGTDQAGATTAPLDLAGFYWEPDADPDLTESRVSAAPDRVYPGDVVAFTLGVRNVGFQESLVALTDTLPTELTVLTDTISGGGQYNAGSGMITWTLDALWPGETRYLFFSARVDEGLAPTEPLTLANRLDLLGYWTWEDPYGVMPPAPPSHAEVTTTTLSVLPIVDAGASAESGVDAPPEILAAAVLEGEVVGDPQVTLLVDTTPDAEFVYLKEWTWDTISDTWTLAQKSGWVPFEEASGFDVRTDAFGKQGRYQWTLSGGDGVKYIGVWVADGQQRATNLNDGNLVYTNLVGAGGQTLDAGERVQYRIPLQPGALAIFNLVTLSGDADLYVWKPRFAFRPHFYSNAAQTGFHLDTVGFYGEEERVHVVEVEATAGGTTYRLVTAGDLPGADLLADTQASLTPEQRAALAAWDEAVDGARDALPQGVQLALADKDRPTHPLTLTTPYGLAGTDELPQSPLVPPTYTIYLPLVTQAFEEE